MWGRAINPNPFYKGWFITLSSLKYSQIQKVFAAFCALLEQKPSLCKIFDLKARRFWMIFVLLGRRNALCLSRHNRAKAPKSAALRRARICRSTPCTDIIITTNFKKSRVIFLIWNFFLRAYLRLSRFLEIIPKERVFLSKYGYADTGRSSFLLHPGAWSEYK